MFPPKTDEYVTYHAERILEDSRPYLNTLPRKLARHSKNYGFEDMILSGDYVPDPRFTNHMVTCFNEGLELYLIALKLDELEPKIGLDPRIHLVDGLRDAEQIDDKKARVGKRKKPESNLESRLQMRSVQDLDSDEGLAHTIVDVKIPKRKSRFLIDPQLGHNGFVEFDYRNQRIRYQPGKYAKWKILTYDSILKLSLDELMERIEYDRSPEGSVRMLECGQRLKTFVHLRQAGAIYVTYDKERNALIGQTQMVNPIMPELVVTNSMQLDSDASIKSQSLEFSACDSLNWMKQIGKKEFGVYDISAVRSFWKALEIGAGLQYKDPKAFLRKTNSEPATWKLRELGVPNMLNQNNQLPKFLPGDLVAEVDGLAAQVRSHYQESIKDEEVLAKWALGHNRWIVYALALNDVSDDYLFSYEDHIKLFEHLRKKKSKFVVELHDINELTDEINSHVKWVGVDPSKAMARYMKIKKEYEQLTDIHHDYLQLHYTSKPLFRRIRDIEMNIAKSKHAIKKLDDDFENDRARYMQDHGPAVFAFFCDRLEKMMVRAYQVRGTITLRKYFKHIQPKVSAYLSTKH